MTANPQKIPIAFKALHRFESWLAKSSRIPIKSFYDAQHFPFLSALEANSTAIAKEMQAVFAKPESVPPFQEISKIQGGLTQDERWRTYFLLAYGIPIQSHLDACPITAASLQQVPGLRTAMFSCLEPGKSLPLHRGPYRGLLRVHLGLEVPSSQIALCGIEVDGVKMGWRNGAAFVFDDTCMHRAWNLTDKRRIVLFLDILRPMRRPADWVNRALIFGLRYTPYGRKAIADFRQWYDQHPASQELAKP